MDNNNRIIELENYIKELKEDLKYLGDSENIGERNRIIQLIKASRDMANELKNNRERYKVLVDEYNQAFGEYVKLINSPNPDVNKLIELQTIIKDNDFARNKINGIVDEQALAEDKEILKASEILEKQLEERKNERKSLKKQNEFLESLEKDEERKKKKELLMEYINAIMDVINELEDLYSELEKCKEGTPKYKEIMSKIKNKKDVLQKLGGRLKELAKELKIPRALANAGDFSNLDANALTELKENISNLKVNMDKDAIKEKIAALDKDIENRENIKPYQEMKKNKILNKYGIENGDASLIDAKVAEIRSKRNLLYPINQMKMIEQNQLDNLAPKTTPVSEQIESTPKTTPAAETKSSIKTHTTPEVKGSTIEASPVQEVKELNQESAQPKMNNLPIEINGENKKLFEINGINSSNIKEYLKNPGMERMQRINNGKLYRFEKEDDKLIYLEEDIQDKYLNNPKKALKKAVKDLRERLLKEYGRKGVKEFRKYLEKEDKKLAELFSNSFIIRGDAIDAYAKAIGKGNGGELKQAKMAMALNSIILMEDVKETLQRKEEPYKNESDLIVKVEKKKFRLFPTKLTVRKQPEFIQNVIRDDNPVEALTTEWLPDGTVRTNFLVKPSDIKKTKQDITVENKPKRSRVRERKEKEEMSI